jgi:hypothetical protein
MDDEEFQLMWQLVAQADAERAAKLTQKEFRLYYNPDDGTVIGLWERDFPEGKYIVLTDPDQFHRQNTSLIRIKNEKLTVLNPNIAETFRLQRSTQGQSAVKGHAVLALSPEETYHDIEYYEPRNN